MNVERTFQIILTELGLDALRHQDNLEEVLNSKLDIKEKTARAKEALHEMVITELMIAKFNSFIPKNNDVVNPEIKNG